MKRLILFFYVLVSCTGILAQPFFNAVDEKLKTFVTATKVPGLSISISKKGVLIYSVGFGFEDVKNEIQVRQNFVLGVSPKLIPQVDWRYYMIKVK
jgi:hypothetical protein